MDVFLVPVGAEAYELYCEDVEEPADEPAGPPKGFFQRLRLRFSDMLAEAERERRQGAVAAEGAGVLHRVKRRSMRWVAETIAEQRLLWSLRRVREARFHYPDDMQGPAAFEIMRRHLSRDFEKHRFWLAIDSLLMLASGLLILIPGPNIIGYYFAFRVVGHFFSVRGARNGLVGVKWTFEPSPPLTDLRGALGLEPAVRLRQVEDIASRLRLDHLATFFQRTATS
ncbi:MAG TPA: hypothetical protein VM364_11050 [Vicinamibacterales bacterium]|nr:hypothetical protein [Vicinamibacterales bacterium]